MRLLYVVNVDWFFISHRLPIAIEAQKKNFEVHLALEVTSHKKFLENHGFKVHPIKIKRGKFSFFYDTILFLKLINIFLKIKPNIVHLVTIKAIIFGGIISKILKIKSVVYSVAGLGFVFVDKGLYSSIRKYLVKNLYKLAFNNKQKKIIFQNYEDKLFLTRLANLNLSETILIPGSGVDLTKFNMSILPKGKLNFLMASRMIKEKGVWEFVEAAKIINQKFKHVKFTIAGSVDHENPSSLKDEDLRKIDKNKFINVLGEQKEMNKIIQQSHVVVLPSYYGEGVPKILIEAAACGRAIITTDTPGCRDTINPDSSGLLIPSKDINALVKAIEKIILSPNKIFNMGVQSRKLAESKFSIRYVVKKHLDIYVSLGALR